MFLFFNHHLIRSLNFFVLGNFRFTQVEAPGGHVQHLDSTQDEPPKLHTDLPALQAQNTATIF